MLSLWLRKLARMQAFAGGVYGNYRHFLPVVNVFSVRARWYQHFHGVLNIERGFNPDVIGDMRQLPVRTDMDAPPTAEELHKAPRSLRLNKAAGRSGILPELLVYGGTSVFHEMHTLMACIWLEGVVDDWRDAAVVPIPKNKGLKCSDNWRCISLLDVAGKVFARSCKIDFLLLLRISS